MNPTENGQRNQLNKLPSLASELGFSCCKDAQGNWRIQPQGYDQRWYLQQARERWLLVVGNIPQILFQASEACHFIKRRLQA